MCCLKGRVFCIFTDVVFEQRMDQKSFRKRFEAAESIRVCSFSNAGNRNTANTLSCPERKTWLIASWSWQTCFFREQHRSPISQTTSAVRHICNFRICLPKADLMRKGVMPRPGTQEQAPSKSTSNRSFFGKRNSLAYLLTMRYFLFSRKKRECKCVMFFSLCTGQTEALLRKTTFWKALIQKSQHNSWLSGWVP
jgi:hypothetical protein